MQRFGSHVALALLLGLFVLALVDAASEDPTSHASVGRPATSFTLPVAGTDEATGPQDHQGDVVVIDFWATYCEPCRDAMPTLQRLHDAYRDQNFALLSVNLDPNRASYDRAQWVLEFVRSQGLTFPVLLDFGQASEAYNVLQIPHLVVIDRRGVVRYVHQQVSEGRLRDEIDGLLAEDS